MSGNVKCSFSPDRAQLSEKSPLLLSDFYDSEQPMVRSLFKAFVESVSDVTFGSPTIAKYIQDGSLSVSDGILRVSPSIQNDDAFSWWITTLISFTARTMLSIEGLCTRDRTAIYSNLCKLSPYFSQRSTSSSVKHHVKTCKKYRRASLRANSDERSSPNKQDSPKTKTKCPGEQCLRRKKMQYELEMQARILQNYWRLIRQSVQRLMRGEPIAGAGAAAADAKYANRDDALATGIVALCKLDPHQLFQKLECVSREHVMRIKISLWDVLVTPNKVPCLKKYYDANPPEIILVMAQSKHFIKSLLDEFSKFQEAVKEVSNKLVLLDEEYLKQFGITWKVINHHIFDKIIYQDDLFKSFTPHMESALQVQLNEEAAIKASAPSFKNDELSKDQFPELLSGLPELVKSFHLFHRLMLTSREMFRRADLLMQTFVRQQYSLHSRAKVEILEKDLDFFTRQRRMVRKFVCDPKRKDDESTPSPDGAGDNEEVKGEESEGAQAKRILDEEADEAEFIRRFRGLLDYGPNSTERCKLQDEGKQETECKYCNQTHCWCDECSFYHMILCGLVDGDVDVNELDHDNELRNILLENGIENELKFYASHKSRIADKSEKALEQDDGSTKVPNDSSKSDELNSSSLFTLHETAEYCKHIVDSPSTWSVGNFECRTSCKCECEESDDENCSCTKLSWAFPFGKSKRQWDFQHRISSRITPKKKRAKSSATSEIELRQCFISEDKKRVVHMDKKGICVTQITKAVRGTLPSNNDKGAEDSCSDLTDESSDENDDIKVDIQKISENIVREIEKTLANSVEAVGEGIDKNSTSSKDYFSHFFGSGCRKLIDSLMKRKVEGVQNVKSATLEEDTDESLSIGSSIGRCSHGHDHHDSCQGNLDGQKERFGRCDCCYCTYMACDMPSRHDSRRSEEIRQRLRKVLKQREEQTNRSHNSVSSDGRIPTIEKTPVQPAAVENRTVDELLEFINEKSSASNEIVTTAKAAKKARQKQRKLEEKLKKEELENLRKEKEKQKKKDVNPTLQEDKNKKADNSDGAAVQKADDIKTNKKNDEKASKTDERNSDKSKTKSPVKEEIKLQLHEKSQNSNVKHNEGRVNAKSSIVVLEVSPFITPTKLSRAFEDTVANTNTSKNVHSSINSEHKKDEKPKPSFKSQAALASRAAQEGKRTEAKRTETPAKNSADSKFATPFINDTKRGSVLPKSAVKTEEKASPSAVQKPLQTKSANSTPNAGTANQRANSFAQSVVRGIKASNQIIPANNDVMRKQEKLDMFARTKHANSHTPKKLDKSNEPASEKTSKPNLRPSDEDVVHKRAALIAAAATAAGTSLPPLESLTLEQQQKYFAWIKQIEQNLNSQSNSVPENVQSYLSEANIYHQNEALRQTPQKAVSRSNKEKQGWSLNYGQKPTVQQSTPAAAINKEIGAIGSGRPTKSQIEQFHEKVPNDLIQSVTKINQATDVSKPTENINVGLLKETSEPDPEVAVPNVTAAKFGAIGEKPIPRKAFNPYAAYDRETNHILGLSQSPLNSTLAQQMTMSFNNGLSADRSSYTADPTRLIGPIGYTNGGFHVNNTAQLIQPQNPLAYPRPVSLVQNDVDQANRPRNLNSPSSIWQNDDAAKRFVESEECSVFNFSSDF